MLQAIVERRAVLAVGTALVLVLAGAVVWTTDRAARPVLVQIISAFIVVAAVVVLRRAGPAPVAGGIAPARLKDLVLPESTRRQVVALVGLLRNGRRARRLGVELPTGALVVGPPGTGKTLLARVLATETRRTFLAVDAGSLATPWAGHAAALVHNLFDLARQQAPAVVFIDELDAVGASRRRVMAHGGESGHDAVRTVDALLAEIENVTAGIGVFVVGATNHPDMLDPALRSRLSYTITTGLPDLRGRAAILARHWPKRASVTPLDVAFLTERDGLSGRDLRELIRAAGLGALGRGGDAVGREDFVAALHQVRQARSAVRSARVVGEE